MVARGPRSARPGARPRRAGPSGCDALGWRLQPGGGTAEAQAREGAPAPSPDTSGCGALAGGDLGLDVAAASRRRGSSGRQRSPAHSLADGAASRAVRRAGQVRRGPRPRPCCTAHRRRAGRPATRGPRCAPPTLRPEHRRRRSASASIARRARGDDRGRAADSGSTGEADAPWSSGCSRRSAARLLACSADPAGSAQIDAGPARRRLHVGRDRRGRPASTRLRRRPASPPPAAGAGARGSVGRTKGVGRRRRCATRCKADQGRRRCSCSAGTADTVASSPEGQTRPASQPRPRAGRPPPAAGAPSRAARAAALRAPDPVLASGAPAGLRHGGDGRWTSRRAAGRARVPQVARTTPGVLRGADVLPSLGSGALPGEATRSPARSCCCRRTSRPGWPGGADAPSAQRSSARSGSRPRMAGPSSCCATTPAARTTRPASRATASAAVETVCAAGDRGARHGALAAEALRGHSLLDGVEPDPVGDHRAGRSRGCRCGSSTSSTSADGAPDELDGWRLGADRLAAARADAGARRRRRAVTSRVPLTTGAGGPRSGRADRALPGRGGRARRDGHGEVDDAVRASSPALGGAAGSLDLLGAALDGVREALLGLPAALRSGRATPTAAPCAPAPGAHRRDLLRAGAAAAAAPASSTPSAARSTWTRPTPPCPPGSTVPGAPASACCARRASARRRGSGCGWSAPPRCARGAPSTRASTRSSRRGRSTRSPASCCPTTSTSRSRCFDVDGTPLGELLVGRRSAGGVCGSRRPGGRCPSTRRPARGSRPAGVLLARSPPGWSAPTPRRAAAGRPRGGRGVGAVGLPARDRHDAVDRRPDRRGRHLGRGRGDRRAARRGRRARCWRSTSPTISTSSSSTRRGRAARAAAYRDLARLELPVRLGELTRTDDGLLGYFLDDDFTRAPSRRSRGAPTSPARPGAARPPRAVGRDAARPGGRPDPPPYLVAEDEVRLRVRACRGSSRC